MTSRPVELDVQWDQVDGLDRGRIVLAGEDQAGPVWEGLYGEYPADPLLNPVHAFGIHSGIGELPLLWRSVIWAATDGLSRFVIPCWWRDKAAEVLEVSRDEIPLVDWEYEISPYEVPLAQSDVGFIRACSSYRIPAEADPWSDAQRDKAGLFPVASLWALSDVHLTLVGDASSELSVWALPTPDPAALLGALRGAERPTLAQTLSGGGIFADLSMTHDLVGDPKDILTLYAAPGLREHLEPVLDRASAAWAAYVSALPATDDFAGFAAALDRLVAGVLGQSLVICDEVLPLFLAAASPPGRAHLAPETEPDEGRLHYLDASVVADYIADRYARRDFSEVDAMLGVVELVLTHGDAEARQLATIGHLESLQGVIARAGTSDRALFARMEGESQRTWKSLNRFWAGEPT